MSLPWWTRDDNDTLRVLLECLLVYTLVFSVADGVTNRFYRRVWPRATACRRRRIMFYLVVHNALYYLIYITPLVLIAVYARVRLGWFVLYLVGIAVLQLHWRTNNDRCAFTDIQNNLLGIDDDYAFRDPYAVVTHTYPRNNLARSRMYHSYTFACAAMACVAVGLKVVGY